MSLSAVRLAFGLPGPIPPQPARDWVSISRIKRVEALRPPSCMERERRAPLIWVLGSEDESGRLVGFMDNGERGRSWIQ